MARHAPQLRDQQESPQCVTDGARDGSRFNYYEDFKLSLVERSSLPAPTPPMPTSISNKVAGSATEDAAEVNSKVPAAKTNGAPNGFGG